MDAWERMTDEQRAAAQRVLREESVSTRHVVVALSGGHAYGFPSADSDVDLKAVHMAPTEQFLGIQVATPVRQRMEFVDGVEIDYTSNEIGAVLSGVLSGNGNYLERIIGPCALVQSPRLGELRGACGSHAQPTRLSSLPWLRVSAVPGGTQATELQEGPLCTAHHADRHAPTSLWASWKPMSQRCWTAAEHPGPGSLSKPSATAKERRSPPPSRASSQSCSRYST